MNDRPDEQTPPFDERAALDELERFRGQIERHKARRRAVDAEFEGFIRSFKTPAEGHVTPPAILTEQTRFTPVVESTALPPVVESAALPPPAVSPSPARFAGRHRRAGRRVVIGGALVLLAGSALATWTWTRRASAPSAAPGPAAPQTTLPAAVEPPAAVRVPAPSADSELVTSRPVWVRVLADGQRVVERELPANARVPLKADKTIVIRTGDAGAIRLTIRGRDVGVLGRDGVVVTRTFSVPPPQKP